jgi:hypothetical protein
MKKILMNLVAVGVAAGSLGVAATAVMAQDAMATTTVSFIDADTDKNEDVTPGEAKVVWPELTDEQFMMADADKSGGLNQQEYDALAAGTTPPPSAGGTADGAMAAPAADAMAPDAMSSMVSFVDADTDKNEDVTPAEAMAAWPDLTEEQFAMADVDKSGGLSQQEYDALTSGTMAPPAAVNPPAPTN